MFPGLTAQNRYDMAMAMLNQGMSAASQSDNPLLAFLSPIAGAVIGGKLQGKADAAAAEDLAGINETLLGTMASDPTAKGYIDIMSNPDAPDYAKSMAKARLETMMKPQKAKASAVGATAYPGKAPGNTDAVLAALLHRAMDPEGDGGSTITAKEQAQIGAVRDARSRSSSVSYDYGATPITEDDPLGILD